MQDNHRPQPQTDVLHYVTEAERLNLALRSLAEVVSDLVVDVCLLRAEVNETNVPMLEWMEALAEVFVLTERP